MKGQKLRGEVRKNKGRREKREFLKGEEGEARKMEERLGGVRKQNDGRKNGKAYR